MKWWYHAIKWWYHAIKWWYHAMKWWYHAMKWRLLWMDGHGITTKFLLTQYLREKVPFVESLPFPSCFSTEPWMAPSQTQCTATAPAVHCIRPCSALRLSLQTFATVPANVCGIRRLSGRNGSLVAGYMQSKVQHLHFEPCPSAIFITLMTD